MRLPEPEEEEHGESISHFSLFFCLEIYDRFFVGSKNRTGGYWKFVTPGFKTGHFLGYETAMAFL